MKHKLFTLFFALLASMTIANAEVYSGTCGDSLTWSLNTEDGVLIVSGTGAMTSYSSWIGGPWYSNLVKTVIIEDGVTSIGAWAFYRCQNLTSATIASSVTSIEYYAFFSCANLATIYNYSPILLTAGSTAPSSSYIAYYATEVHNLYTYSGTCNSFISWTLTAGVLTITGTGSMPNYSTSNQAPWYDYSSTVQSLIISEGITRIGNYAFRSCDKLCSVTIPSSVTSIGERAFGGYGLLLEVPSQVTTIGSYAFSDAANVSYTGSATGSPWGARCVNGCVDGMVVYSDSSKANVATCSSAATGKIVLSDSAMSIGDAAFWYCKNMTGISMPNKLQTIGGAAFCGCSKLDSVIIPDSVILLNYMAFYDCASLKSIIIPDKVEYIGSDAFYGCSNLESITIGTNVQTIEECMLQGCNSLKTVVWKAKNCSDFTSKNTPFYHYHEKSKYQSAGVTYNIRNNITSFTFGDEVEYIPAYLCTDMINVEEIVVPNCHVQIGTNAFSGCNYRIDGTYKITLPDTTLCYGDELYVDGVRCDLSPDPEYFQTWTRTYQTIAGCDSIIEMSVRWTKLPSYIETTTKGEYDYLNSGSITISYQDRGHYDYYTLNGEKNASLNNLASGNYVMIFYHTLCGDSLVKNITIEQYGIKVGGMYYLLDETNQTATLTYRGTSYDSYSGEYSGNITIPKKITFNGKDYKVTGINSYTFSGCNNIKSLILESDTPLDGYNIGLTSGAIVYVPFGSLNAYKSNSSWRNYNLHVINPTHVSSNSNATSANINFGNSEEKGHIVSCGVDGGGEFPGNIVEYIGLEPNSEYSNVPFFVRTREGDYDTIHYSFTTTALELTTKPAQPVSSTTALLFAETNMADVETSCGFEWKRTTAPDDMPGTKVYCPVASGQMAGRLKNLQNDVYYKYRAFYLSAAGISYNGEWQYIFTGDVTVEFDPVLYTYTATNITEHTATISGYALAGATDFEEQGFEYWAESRVTNSAPARMSAAIGEHIFVQATGIRMAVTLSNLDAGTNYKYRAYGKVGNQYYYGSEQGFTTQGTYVPPTYLITFVNWDNTELQTSYVEEGLLPEYTGETPVRPEDEQYKYVFNGWTPSIVVATTDAIYTATYTATPKNEGIEDVMSGNNANKIFRNGQIFILRGGKTYTVQGTEIR